jgi:hypothetical protein
MQLDTKDTPPDWETKWANEEWDVDTLHLTEDEQRFLEELQSEVLPRHMPVWDWNLPFAEKIIVMMRRYSENDSSAGTGDTGPRLPGQ